MALAVGGLVSPGIAGAVTVLDTGFGTEGIVIDASLPAVAPTSVVPRPVAGC